jgi:hypothetical protein
VERLICQHRPQLVAQRQPLLQAQRLRQAQNLVVAVLMRQALAVVL